MRRPGLARSISASKYDAKSKPTVKRGNTAVLEEVLAAGQGLHRKVMEMLKQLDPSMPEYTELLDREAKLSAKINQVKNQLGLR